MKTYNNHAHLFSPVPLINRSQRSSTIPPINRAQHVSCRQYPVKNNQRTSGISSYCTMPWNWQHYWQPNVWWSYLTKSVPRKTFWFEVWHGYGSFQCGLATMSGTTRSLTCDTVCACRNMQRCWNLIFSIHYQPAQAVMGFNALIWTLHRNEITQISGPSYRLRAACHLVQAFQCVAGAVCAFLWQALTMRCLVQFGSALAWEWCVLRRPPRASRLLTVFNSTLISVMPMILISNYYPVDTTIYSHWVDVRVVPLKMTHTHTPVLETLPASSMFTLRNSTWRGVALCPFWLRR
jgi:hypothetical protein